MAAEKVQYMMMSPDEVQARAQRDADDGKVVDVYDWQYRKLDTPVPASIVKAMLSESRSAYLALRAAHTEETDEQLRERMFEQDARFKAFGHPDSGTHPRLFEKMTKPELPAEHFQLILKMVDMRRQQENGMPLEKATAQVTQFFKTEVAKVVSADEASAAAGKGEAAARVEEA